MDDNPLLRYFRLMVTPPGKKTRPLGLIEADSEASAWLLVDRLLQNKVAEETLDPDSRVELVDPGGNWLWPVFDNRKASNQHRNGTGTGLKRQAEST